MSTVALLFLLIAVLMVIGTLFPGWNFSAGPVLAPNRLIGLVIGLIVLFILYVIVVALFGAGPVARAATLPEFALGGGLMVGVLDTSIAAPNDPTAPKAWYFSKSFWLGVALTLVGVSTYFTDPLHTPTLTVASISEAIGGILAIVLRVWFTSAPIAGTGLADKAEVAKQDIAIRAAIQPVPPPPH